MKKSRGLFFSEGGVFPLRGRILNTFCLDTLGTVYHPSDSHASHPIRGMRSFLLPEKCSAMTSAKVVFMINPSHTKKAYLAAITQVSLVGLSLLFIKVALVHVSPLDLLNLRFLLAALVVLVARLIGGEGFHLPGRDLLAILPLTLFYPIIFFGLQAFGLVYATTTEGGIIGATVPLFTLIMASLFLKEKTNTRQKFMVILSVIGLSYLTVVNNASLPTFSIKGNALLFGSSLAMALYLVFVRKASQRFRFQDITAVILIFGSLFFALFSAISYGSIGAYFTSFKSLAIPSVAVSVFFLGFFCSFVTSLLNNYALTHLEASQVAVLSNLTPLITTLAGVLILHEPFSVHHGLGILMTLLGVIGVTYFGKSPT